LTENPKNPKSRICQISRNKGRFDVFIVSSPRPEKFFTKKISGFFHNSKKNFKILKNFQKKFEGRKKFPEIFLRNSGNSEKNFKNFHKKIPGASGTNALS
jgi:hypothetical protein